MRPQAMRDYTGVVFDIGHQAVGYEDIPASLQKLVDNGVQIVKLQEAAAVYMPERHPEDHGCAEAVRQDDLPVADVSAEGRQDDLVPQSRGRVRGLPQGSRARASGARTSTCRCSSTTSAARSAPRGSRSSRRWPSTRRRRISTHLEIETYTWDVLPDHLKTGRHRRIRDSRDRLGEGSARVRNM